MQENIPANCFEPSYFENGAYRPRYDGRGGSKWFDDAVLPGYTIAGKTGQPKSPGQSNIGLMRGL
jgi:hypothetical protein